MSEATQNDPVRATKEKLTLPVILRKFRTLIRILSNLLLRLFSFLRGLPHRGGKILRNLFRELTHRGLKALRIIHQEGWLGLWYAFQERFHLADLDVYELWQRRHRLTSRDRNRIKKAIKQLPHRPLISLLLPVYNTEEIWLKKCLDSVLGQLYPYWELCIADDASTAKHIRRIVKKYAARDRRIRVVFREVNGHISAASNSALALATGEYIALLDHDDELTPDALYEIASLVSCHSDVDMIYSDEDKIDTQGKRHCPFFKPDWSPDTFLSLMYTCHLGVYRTALVRRIGGFREGFEGSQDYDLVLRLTEHTDRIRHIPKVLYHWRSIPASSAANFQTKGYAQDAGLRAIREALQRRGEEASVESVEGMSGRYRVRYRFQGRPRVSIVIPTRDLSAFLETCLKSIFEKTAYDRFEVIVVDNDSREPETLDLFRRWKEKEPSRFRVAPLPIAFNFPALINEGVRNAEGDLVLLLNNDIEVLSEDWLSEMAAQALRPRIGAVGVKLLYPDDTVQHAGVVLGIGGIAGHSHKYSANDRPGYFDRLRITANCAAVTAACLMVKKARFQEVGGFDEALSVAFNDVDFCLKLLKSGYYNLCLSHLTLYHHESQTRGPEDTVEKQLRFKGEIDLMKERWGSLLKNDPFYSPHLTRDIEDFSICVDPT
ncbi:MAG: glycosyltransferase family 2 protein [Deltaproteobacteria bacterium]|nr:glycosyltransferase family 2 protein [Deltaproteobacteria bacterium]